MNERIKELAEHAIEYASDNQSADIPYHWFNLYSDKFSELVILECLSKISDLIVDEDFKNLDDIDVERNKILGSVVLEIEHQFFGDQMQ